MCFLLYEIVQQQGNIFATLTKRGNHDGKNIDPIKEIFSECSLGYQFGQLTVCCTDQTYIDPDRRSAADAFKLMLLQNPKQFDLNVQRKLPDFVQEQSTAVCSFKSSAVPLKCTGKSSLFMTEELAVCQMFRNCATVQFYKRT